MKGLGVYGVKVWGGGVKGWWGQGLGRSRGGRGQEVGVLGVKEWLGSREG